ncbi:hypothetical protein ABZP36_028667 [Zizania latifolia]
MAVNRKAATFACLLPAAAVSSVVHGDIQVPAFRLLAAAGALRGDSAPVPVPDIPPPRPHRRLHRPHGPLPPLLPLPYRPPPLSSPLPPSDLTAGAVHHGGAGPGLLPVMSARSRSVLAAHLLASPACGAAGAHSRFPTARCLSTSDGDDEEGDTPSQADSSHPEHVGRVCAPIADVVTAGADANLEAALSALSPSLSEALVLAVLDRFKHAHRPSHRFFRLGADPWSVKRGDSARPVDLHAEHVWA